MDLLVDLYEARREAGKFGASEEKRSNDMLSPKQKKLLKAWFDKEFKPQTGAPKTASNPNGYFTTEEDYEPSGSVKDKVRELGDYGHIESDWDKYIRELYKNSKWKK
jgi:hypothetical protein